MNENYRHFMEFKHRILCQFPTNIGRFICVPHVIEISHSVNKWLYERWLKNGSVETELASLHSEMSQKISNYLGNPDIQIKFVHLDPRKTKHVRASY